MLLEPTQARRLAGDFSSGKRISMRKVLSAPSGLFASFEGCPDSRQHTAAADSYVLHRSKQLLVQQPAARSAAGVKRRPFV